MAPLPVAAWGEPSENYDPNCIPQRYKPCPAQLIDEKIGAGRPGMSPNAVVVLVFFLTVAVWIGCYFGFMWWLGRDIDKIREIIEEENMGVTRIRLMRVNASGNDEESGKNGDKNGGKGKKNGK